jgi:hypothetical protein
VVDEGRTKPEIGLTIGAALGIDEAREQARFPLWVAPAINSLIDNRHKGLPTIRATHLGLVWHETL